MTHHSIFFLFQILIELVPHPSQLFRLCYLSVNTTFWFWLGELVSWIHDGGISNTVTKECCMCTDVFVFCSIDDACLLMYMYSILSVMEIESWKWFKHLIILCWDVFIYDFIYVESIVGHLGYLYLIRMSWVYIRRLLLLNCRFG